ncbi:hypothetical protein BY996DRAFT_7178416 [Phakopsora pachyrhizi]|uniref:Expressed protein n=1 Tax=Phakopsora pachyrhizi TaxID=170000 RepID=A0AAV0AUC0_PHAPC|nr:hypothetical protein BY996DRAFT_7178416 [Phakopsora pachyrhizi]CAH7672327.1 expressed protein [Phakopsora pachyrhizi]
MNVLQMLKLYNNSLTILMVIIFLSNSRPSGSFLITSPNSEDDTWYIGHHKTLTWSSVLTDPSRFSISIVNNDPGTYPTGLVRPLKSGISKSRSSFMLPSSAIRGLREGPGYQINIMSEEGGSILAQSSIFTLSSEEEAYKQSSTTANSEDDEQLQGVDPSSSESSKHPTESQHQDQQLYQSKHQNLSKHHRASNHHQPTRSKDSDSSEFYGSDQSNNEHSVGLINNVDEIDEQLISLRDQKLSSNKKKSDRLFRSIPRFDNHRVACGPNRPQTINGARILRL